MPKVGVGRECSTEFQEVAYPNNNEKNTHGRYRASLYIIEIKV